MDLQEQVAWICGVKPTVIKVSQGHTMTQRGRGCLLFPSPQR